MTIYNSSEHLPKDTDQYDYCVIGGGVVGLSTALTLGQKNPDKKIVLLESGEEQIGGSQAAAKGEVIGEGVQTLEASRIRALGGTQWVWGGHSSPLRPFDFIKRDWIPNSGWPISYEDYYRFIPDATRILDIDDLDWSNRHPQVKFMDIGGHSFFENYLFKLSPAIPGTHNKNNKGHYGESRKDEIKQQQNLDVFLNQTVTGLNFDSNLSRVTGAETCRLDQKKSMVNANRFILCAGGIENARLLKYWLSNEKAPRLPCFYNIGRYFMEHPHRDIAKVMITENQLKLYEYHIGKRLGTAVHMIRFGIKEEAQKKHQLNAQSIIMVKKSSKSLGLHMKAITISEQTPEASNRVELGLEKDIYGIPRTELHWSFSDQDEYSMNFIAKKFPEFTGRYAIGKSKSVLFPKDTRFPGGHHHMGTTRMGDSAQNAVVDKNCKIFGLDNFYVAGGSVFSTSGGVNPTLSMLALSQRLCFHLNGLGS